MSRVLGKIGGSDAPARPMQWATLFIHDESDEESRKAVYEVVRWASELDIEVHFKMVTNRNIQEYSLEVGPLGVPPVTLRYFDYEHGAPRREFKGLKEILDFVMP